MKLNEEHSHEPRCGLCRGFVDEIDTKSYQAAPTRGGPDIHEVTYEDGWISVRSINLCTTKSNYNSFPSLYLVHKRCYDYFKATPFHNVPLRYIIASATPLCQTEPENLSDMAAAALVKVVTKNQIQILEEESYGLIQHMQNAVPMELQDIVLSHCQYDTALAIIATCYLGERYMFEKYLDRYPAAAHFQKCICKQNEGVSRVEVNRCIEDM
ncbi:hypothetical protein P154DRAFT_580958 [Amniculicola lignicola CBS 123094]|uniref:Uncharacterized protein n=1 Tax=Amniculicola lignicola CBS 123094 TaxID=1392246 RepID=A0A6A5W0K0_9PLEO|nr:hypothetical protein P154DRAFT_580958 [Amniculicola lignicola CBS 123094]